MKSPEGKEMLLERLDEIPGLAVDVFLKIRLNTWSLGFLSWSDNADLQLDSFLICATFFCPPEWQLVLIFYSHSVHHRLCFDCAMSEHREINGGCSEEQRMKMVLVTSFMALLEPVLQGSYWKYGSFGTFHSWSTHHHTWGPPSRTFWVQISLFIPS